MPASEYTGWQAYFKIYPFTQDREDMRAALIAERITNSIGQLIASLAHKRTYTPIKIDTFMPDYFKERRTAATVEKSLEQQEQEFADFARRYKAAIGQR
jgi:hypothetical protein